MEFASANSGNVPQAHCAPALEGGSIIVIARPAYHCRTAHHKKEFFIMKKTFILSMLLAVALASGLLFVSCPSPTSSTPSTPKEPELTETVTEYNGFDSTTDTAYKLTITTYAYVSRAAAPQDTYKLEITLKTGEIKTSTGTVQSFEPNSQQFTLKLTNSNTTFTVTVSSVVITNIPEPIPLDGGGSLTVTGTISPAFTSIADFKTWLAGKPANTANTAYNVNLNVSDLGGNSFTDGSVGKALRDNSTKYVNLDLSGSTFTSIVVQAFERCISLTGVTIPKSVTGNNGPAFAYCTNLAAITVDAANTAYISTDGILYNKNKTTLITYPAGKTGSSFTIPNSVTSISSSAFLGCASLASVAIPSSVTFIAGSIFQDCTSLAEITVDAANTAYSSQDGVLYDLGKTKLVAYPGGKTGAFTIPNSVTSIENFAFSGCTSLTSVTIPSGITSIGNYAFQSCNGLTSITIPDSVISIGNNAFSLCTSLVSVTFATGSNIPDATFGTNAFPEGNSGSGGNTLKNAYSTGKAGTYTRPANGATWTKQS